jgi:hypothetical protein
VGNPFVVADEGRFEGRYNDRSPKHQDWHRRAYPAQDLMAFQLILWTIGVIIPAAWVWRTYRKLISGRP